MYCFKVSISLVVRPLSSWHSATHSWQWDGEPDGGAAQDQVGFSAESCSDLIHFLTPFFQYDTGFLLKLERGSKIPAAFPEREERLGAGYGL